MKQLLYIVSLFVLFTASVCGQVVTSNNTFQSNNVDFSNADAYYIYDSTTTVITTGASRMYESESRNKTLLFYSYRIKINTKSGVDEYAFMTFNPAYKRSLVDFEVVNYKSDKSVVKFDSTQIFKTIVPNEKSKKSNVEILKYVIPNVEVGDEIEVKYSLSFPRYMAKFIYGTVFFNTNIPALQRTQRITIPSKYKLRFKCYNGFRSPVMNVANNSLTYTFTASNLEAVDRSTFPDVYGGLPNFYYEVDKTNKTNYTIEWYEYYNNFAMFVNSPFNGYMYNSSPYFSSKARFNGWVKGKLKEAKTLTKYQKFELLYSAIKTDFEIIEASSNPYDRTARLINLLKQKEITQSNLYRLYFMIFRYLDIQPYLCLDRNKYLGKINFRFLRKNEITDYYFVYYDENNKPICVYPHDIDLKYNLNELPSYLNHTEHIIIKNKMLTAYSIRPYFSTVLSNSGLDIKTLTTDVIPYEQNLYSRTRIINIDLDSTNCKYQSTIQLSGYQSVGNRSVYNNLLNDKEAYNAYVKELNNDRDLFKIDSVYLINQADTFPHNYEVGIKGELNNFYSRLNDSTIVISLKEMLKDFTLDVDKNRTINFLLPSAYLSVNEVIVVFDTPIKVLNKEALSKSLENSTAKYSFNYTMLDNKRIKITSTYGIKHELIKRWMFDELKSVNKATNEMVDTRIVIGVK